MQFLHGIQNEPVANMNWHDACSNNVFSESFFFFLTENNPSNGESNETKPIKCKQTKSRTEAIDYFSVL